MLAVLTSVGALASSASAVDVAAGPAGAHAVAPPADAALSASPTAAPASVSGRVMVRFAPGTSAEARASAVRAVGGHIDDEIPSLALFRVAVPADGSDGYGAAATAQALMAQPGVVSAEPDEVVRLELTPNDEHYLRDPYAGLGQWGIRKAQVDLAWDSARASNITVAVIDSGVDPAHPDLQGALLPGRTYLAAPQPTCSATATRDDNSHGTHVTGIIAANAGNGIGVAGVAFGAKVLPLKALDCEGHGLTSDVAKAIAEAIDSGAKIINISLGSARDSATLRSAIDLAHSRNVLVVAAAGNCGGVPLDARCSVADQVSYPAAYPSVVAVGATEPDDTRSSFSTQADYVDIAAPGRRIVSTAPTYGTTVGALRYAAFSGTSMAAPFISGVAALIWGREPALTATQVRERLIATAQDLGAAGRDNAFGAGRVDALRAVTPATPLAPVAPAAPAARDVATAIGPYAATYTVAAPAVVLPGSRVLVPITVRNDGPLAWAATGPDPVRLAAHIADVAGNTVLWDGARTNFTAPVPPGASVATNVILDVPRSAGTYRVRVDLVREGIAWFSGGGVATGDSFVTAVDDLRGTLPAGPVTVSRAAPSVSVTLRNGSAATWTTGGAVTVALASHWLDAEGRVLLWDGPRTALPRSLPPGESITIAVRLAAVPAGATQIVIDVVADGLRWGGIGTTRPVTLVP